MSKRDGWGIGELGRVPESSPLDDLEAIRLTRRRAPDYPGGRKLACGHTVYYARDVMTTGRGTSCPGCYDRMSDE